MCSRGGISASLAVDEASLVVPSSRPDGSLTGSVQVRVGPLTCSHPGGVGAYPDVHRVLAQTDGAPAATAHLSAWELLAACAEMRYPPAGVRFDDDYPPPPLRVTIDADGVTLTVDWPSYGPARRSRRGAGAGAGRVW